MAKRKKVLKGVTMSVKLEAEDAEDVKLLANFNNMSKSNVLRQMIKRYLNLPKVKEATELYREMKANQSINLKND